MASDRSAVGFSGPALAPRSSFASIHRGPALSGKRDSGRLDVVPAYRHRGGSVFDTLGTSMAAATRSERGDHGYPTAESRPRTEQPFGRVTPEKSRAFCGRGVLFSSVEVSHREAADRDAVRLRPAAHPSGEHDMLPDAYPARDGLTDLAGSMTTTTSPWLRLYSVWDVWKSLNSGGSPSPSPVALPAALPAAACSAGV